MLNIKFISVEQMLFYYIYLIAKINETDFPWDVFHAMLLLFRFFLFIFIYLLFDLSKCICDKCDWNWFDMNFRSYQLGFPKHKELLELPLFVLFIHDKHIASASIKECFAIMLLERVARLAWMCCCFYCYFIIFSSILYMWILFHRNKTNVESGTAVLIG